jgi:hypothetical protein
MRALLMTNIYTHTHPYTHTHKPYTHMDYLSYGLPNFWFFIRTTYLLVFTDLSKSSLSPHFYNEYSVLFRMWKGHQIIEWSIASYV